MTVTIIPAPVGVTLLVEDDDGEGLLKWGTVIGFAVTQRETQEGRLLGSTLPVTLYGYDSHDGGGSMPIFGVMHANGTVESMEGETWDSFNEANERAKFVQRHGRGTIVEGRVSQLETTQPPQTSNSALLSTAETAAYLGVAPNTLSIWRHNKRYQIPFVKIGAKVKYRKEDLDAWLASRTVGGADAT